MAYNVIGWALAQPLPSGEKLVLIALANYASKDGSNARPAVATLAGMTGYSRRSVIRCLAALEARDLIEPTAYPRGGHGKSTVWSIRLDNGAKSAPLNGAKSAPMNSDISAKNSATVSNNGAKSAPQPVLEPVERTCPRCQRKVKNLFDVEWTYDVCGRCAGEL